jgi:hypothetical protein
VTRSSSARRGGSITARDLLSALGIAAIGALGSWPGTNGEPDPLASAVWLAFIAPACGVACRAIGLRFWPAAVVVPATWMFLIGLADGLSRRDLPRPIWAGAAIAGLFGIGFALGSLPWLRAWRGASIVLLATALLCALPVSGVFLRVPPAPAVTARLLDLAPTTLVGECAGVDWMRHPAIYDAASTSDIDPSLRTPYDGRLAGGLVFVVGCALAWGLQRLADRRWPSTATSAPSPRS